MKSKAPLALIEQLVMLLVFALVAALCLRGFVWAELRSQRMEARTHAVTLVQSAAETIRHSKSLSIAAQRLGGAYEQELLQLSYDQDWQPVSSEGAYHLTAQEIPPETTGLQAAQVELKTSGDQPEVLFALKIAWQEEVQADG